MRLIRLIATLAVAALVMTACSGAGSSPAPASAAPATAAPATAAPASAGASTAASAGGGSGSAVTIKDFAFSPASLTTSGTEVTFTNEDSTAHTVVSDDGKFEPSKDITKGGTPFKATLPGPGSYPYHCGIHPTMKGTIVVS